MIILPIILDAIRNKESQGVDAYSDFKKNGLCLRAVRDIWEESQDVFSAYGYSAKRNRTRFILALLARSRKIDDATVEKIFALARAPKDEYHALTIDEDLVRSLVFPFSVKTD